MEKSADDEQRNKLCQKRERKKYFLQSTKANNGTIGEMWLIMGMAQLRIRYLLYLLAMRLMSTTSGNSTTMAMTWQLKGIWRATGHAKWLLRPLSKEPVIVKVVVVAVVVVDFTGRSVELYEILMGKNSYHYRVVMFYYHGGPIASLPAAEHTRRMQGAASARRYFCNSVL